jgi:pyrroline-5-carboxylate reductase
MTQILFVGCGKMGSALLRGVAQKAEDVAIIKPTPLLNNPDPEKIVWKPDPSELSSSFSPDIIILAIKPQDMMAVLPLYRHYTNSIFLSVAAGITLNRLADLLGNEGHPIVRAMPNLPVNIGKGITAAIANSDTTPDQRALCEDVLLPTGDIIWLDDETLIDPITALSGCGPAYVFALTDAMARAGQKLGIPEAIAQKLTRQTVIGSGALLEASSENVLNLISSVASKGGSTAAALEHLLSDDGFPSLMFAAMDAATRRAKERSS